MTDCLFCHGHAIADAPRPRSLRPDPLEEAVALREVDEIRATAAFHRRLGGTDSDATVLAGHLAEALATIQASETRAQEEDAAKVARDCGLSSAQRDDGDDCKTHPDDPDGEECAACRIRRMVRRECTLSGRERNDGCRCENERRDGKPDPCPVCVAAKAARALDCGLTATERAEPGECGCRNGGDEPMCAECRIASARKAAAQLPPESDCGLSSGDRDTPGSVCRYVEFGPGVECLTCANSRLRRIVVAFEAREVAPPCPDPTEAIRLARAEADLAAALLRLDCGLERGAAMTRCLLALGDGPGDVCGECMIHGIGASADTAKAEARRLQNESDKAIFDLGMMRDRATTAEEALAAALAGKAPPARRLGSHGKALPGQASLFGAGVASIAPAATPEPAAAPPSAAAGAIYTPGQFGPHTAQKVRATLPARPCGCGGKGAHRAACKLAPPGTGTRPGCTGGCNAYGRHRATCALAKGKAPA